MTDEELQKSMAEIYRERRRGSKARWLKRKFSLECRALESNWDQSIRLPWNDAVTQFEQDSATRLAHREGLDGVEHYDTGVRIAFNHGLPDGNSAFDVDHLRVVEVTQEGITLRGKMRARAKRVSSTAAQDTA